MSVMEKIIFLSDYIEPTRNYEGVAELRLLAQDNLNAAVDLTIRRKTEHVKKKGKKLHSRSIAAMHAAGLWANGVSLKRNIF
jgi:nicotinate-nucleotide adenylyltransferase